jgi:hypothetical protein
VEEPDRFAEPAIYLVRPDGTLYFGRISPTYWVRSTSS